jgi:hypothetical protein
LGLVFLRFSDFRHPITNCMTHVTPKSGKDLPDSAGVAVEAAEGGGTL